MGADADGRSDFIDRFVMFRNKMCQISENHSPLGQMYIDILVDSLSELDLGCVMESFPPSRVPSCSRGQDRYSAARVMEIADMRSGLTMRFVGRAVDTDRDMAEKRSFESVLETAGLVYTGKFEEFRLLDIGGSEYSANIGMLGPDVHYVSIRIVKELNAPAHTLML